MTFAKHKGELPDGDGDVTQSAVASSGVTGDCLGRRQAPVGQLHNQRR
jgi:hypothetical protein